MQGCSVNICKINVEKALINSTVSNLLCLLREQSICKDNDTKIAVTDQLTLEKNIFCDVCENSYCFPTVIPGLHNFYLQDDIKKS